MSNHGGGMGRRRMPNEKAKDFSGSMKKLLNYMKRYKIRFFLMLVFAVASTVFSIWGPILERSVRSLYSWGASIF